MHLFSNKVRHGTYKQLTDVYRLDDDSDDEHNCLPSPYRMQRTVLFKTARSVTTHRTWSVDPTIDFSNFPSLEYDNDVLSEDIRKVNLDKNRTVIYSGSESFDGRNSDVNREIPFFSTCL